MENEIHQCISDLFLLRKKVLEMAGDFHGDTKTHQSRNANYSNAIDYLLFQHDESTGKKIKDEMGRSLLRDEFYMDGLNCDPMSFDKECSLTNAKFHKNKNHLKSKVTIISSVLIRMINQNAD